MTEKINAVPVDTYYGGAADYGSGGGVPAASNPNYAPKGYVRADNSSYESVIGGVPTSEIGSGIMAGRDAYLEEAWAAAVAEDTK